MAATKISPYSVTDLKNTTDDALTNYLTGLKWKQSHTLTDVRLALGYAAVVVGAATFLADYKLGWDKTKDWTTVAVALYFLLNMAFSYWIWAVESGLVFEGWREGKKITLCSAAKKFDPTYHLTVTDPSGNSTELEAPFPTWFTADGYFVAKPFQQWLASSVPTIGAVDTKNAAAHQTDELAASASEAEVLEDRSNGAVAASGSAGAKPGASKRSKRKG